MEKMSDYTHCIHLRKLANEKCGVILLLANSFVEGYITEEELCSDAEEHMVFFLERVKQVKQRRDRKEEVC